MRYPTSNVGSALLVVLGAILSAAGAANAADAAAAALDLPVAPGPFKPTMESFKQYECPEWFRDAKFGIWSCWGPQAVPMQGDWYARNMYMQGHAHNVYHVKNYGHPSQFGYKDLIPLWKAEKWDPDRLMRLYQKAGARYFVSMGSHHDNFFLWDSKLHRWNAANMGPKRDVVGEWQKAAKKCGLRFGVSEHLGGSYTWFQTSHGADKTGPLAGVPYDGADPKWQDLYHRANPEDHGINFFGMTWYSDKAPWQQEWYNSIKEVVDNYHPDLLYTDGPVAFGNEVGLSMIAHLYNSNAALHGGRTEAVYNCKQGSEGRWVEDLERGNMSRIAPHPWQTDTSIGDWFYNRNWKFRPVSWVIHMLVDNVSKNGNLLLNVVQRPDGSLDPEVEQMLAQLADWTAIHGEAIYGSRPWLVYGESSVKVQGGSFNENNLRYTAREVRFTTKGPVLYAIALGWPEDGKLVVRSLAKPAGENVNNISEVSLLGYDGKLTWKQTADGLVVTLPEKKVSEYTTGLKIVGDGLQPALAAGNDKTLVTWVTLDNTTQQGGSALTVQSGEAFDGIVFGEVAPGKWMAGSEFLARTQRDQQANAVEKADEKTLIQMAIVYKGNRISIYRNGEPYASYEADNLDLLSDKENIAVFGLRHRGAGTGQSLRGAIEDARIYDKALTAEEIKRLQPKKESAIKPYAWWTFEEGKETDRMGRFPANNLSNGAKIEGGRLVLHGNGAALVAAAQKQP